jgi:hypothetical protein
LPLICLESEFDKFSHILSISTPYYLIREKFNRENTQMAPIINLVLYLISFPKSSLNLNILSIIEFLQLYFLLPVCVHAHVCMWMFKTLRDFAIDVNLPSGTESRYQLPPKNFPVRKVQSWLTNKAVIVY